jgi:hypothetical protein
MATSLRILVPAEGRREFSMTEAVASTVGQVKQKLCRLLNTGEDWLHLSIGAIELKDRQVLTDFGAEEGGGLEITLVILEPPPEEPVVAKAPAQLESFDSFLAGQQANPRPRLIYKPDDDLLNKDERAGTMGRYKKKNQLHEVRVVGEDGPRTVKIEIDHFFGDKPYLGGYRHKKTRKEYHHAATQTEKAAQVAREALELRSQQVQTRPEVDIQLQTTAERATQVPRLGLYVLKEGDRRVAYSGHYTTAEELRNRYLFQVMFVQRVCRGWIARKKVSQMRDVYSRQKDQDVEEKKQKADELYKRKMEEADRCEQPHSKADFDMLYNKLEEWRRGEEEGLQGKEGRALHVARAGLVMQEASMLSKISQNKNRANLEARELAVRDFLERAASPHCWSLKAGGSVRIETPDTQRALVLRNLYIRLK